MLAAALVTAVLFTAARPAAAFTSADAAAVNAYLKAFDPLDGAGSFILGRQDRGNPDFWEEAEEIEDANDVAAAFAAASQDPDFVQAATELSKIIDREVLSLVTKTPYSP